MQTIPGRHWFSYFRFYGPLESYFDRSWKLGDIAKAFRAEGRDEVIVVIGPTGCRAFCRRQ